jgi:hypothetical protein
MGKFVGAACVTSKNQVFSTLKGDSCCAASPSQIGRFETHGLTAQSHLSALSDPSGRWIDQRRPPRGVVLDMDCD